MLRSRRVRTGGLSDSGESEKEECHWLVFAERLGSGILGESIFLGYGLTRAIGESAADFESGAWVLSQVLLKSGYSERDARRGTKSVWGAGFVDSGFAAAGVAKRLRDGTPVWVFGGDAKNGCRSIGPLNTGVRCGRGICGG